MKKLVTIVFVALILACTVLTAFAANGSFVSSPSKNLAPVLVKAENKSEACTARVIITSYADRATLGDKAVYMTNAYNAIATAQNLGALDADVEALAKELGIDVADFAVSDLFDISYVDCDGHEQHGVFTITIKPTSTENFAAVLHFTGSSWEVIEGEVENGEITFETELFSPFAIMVHQGLPASSGNATPWIIGGIALLLIILIIIILLLISRKKKKEAQETAAN